MTRRSLQEGSIPSARSRADCSAVGSLAVEVSAGRKGHAALRRVRANFIQATFNGLKQLTFLQSINRERDGHGPVTLPIYSKPEYVPGRPVNDGAGVSADGRRRIRGRRACRKELP